MTASLYQSGPSAVPEGALLSELVVAGLCVGSALYTEDVRGKRVRAELEVVPGAGPFVAPAPEQVVDEVALAGRDAEILDREVDPAGLHVPGIEVHGHENQVLLFSFRIADQLIVVDRVKAQAPVGMQSGVLLPDPVQSRDHRGERIGSRKIPVLD